jgi:hypothetical protein
MRAYEYYQKNGVRHLNELLEAKRKSLGLLCSFKSQVPLGSSGLYFDINEVKREFQTLCTSLDVDFHIVGINQNSLDWLDEVYKVILGSHMVVVDVSDPRPNVLYELGVTCSLRPCDAVIITKHTSSTFDCSEVQQLQILFYDCLHDLSDKIKQHFKAISWPLESELNEAFSQMHNRLNYKAMILLFNISEEHRKRIGPDGTGPWHISSTDEEFLNSASELVELGLAKHEYDVATKEGQLGWALHPTEIGKRYIESNFFRRFFYLGTAP